MIYRLTDVYLAALRSFLLKVGSRDSNRIGYMNVPACRG